LAKIIYSALELELAGTTSRFIDGLLSTVYKRFPPLINITTMHSIQRLPPQNFPTLFTLATDPVTNVNSTRWTSYNISSAGLNTYFPKAHPLTTAIQNRATISTFRWRVSLENLQNHVLSFTSSDSRVPVEFITNPDRRPAASSRRMFSFVTLYVGGGVQSVTRCEWYQQSGKHKVLGDKANRWYEGIIDNIWWL
jgi:hypothetical protein